MFGGEKGNDLLPMIEERVAKNLKIRPEDVEPDLTISAQCFIDLFWDLHAWRKSSGGMEGPKKIDLSDIKMYCEFSGRVIRWFEAEAIRAIDDCFLVNWRPYKEE